MYEHQDPFKLTDFITMSYFLNQFLYKAVLTNLFGTSCVRLLKIVREKNSRINTRKIRYMCIFKILGITDVKSVSSNPLFISLYILLMAIYRRDCRRTFCPEGHWLAKLSIILVYLQHFMNISDYFAKITNKKKFFIFIML